jgi:hypothetical protein
MYPRYRRIRGRRTNANRTGSKTKKYKNSLEDSMKSSGLETLGLTSLVAHCQSVWNDWAFTVKTNGPSKTANKMLEIDPKRVLSDVLQIPAGKQTRVEMKRATEVLSQLGASPSGQRRLGKKRINVWSIPESYSSLDEFDISKYKKNNLDPYLNRIR